MKKTNILISLAVGVLLLAALPIIGNQFTQKVLEEKINTLKANGVTVQNETTDSSYLLTKRHYEFLVQDSDKFIDYLNNYSSEQLPSYVDSLVDGVVIGSDMEYSNLPFSKAVAVDIYPMRLSKDIQKVIKDEDEKFYTYIEKFLQKKGALYHINYNILSQDFDGYLKDIKETYTLEDSTKISLELLNTLYHGNGKLIAPNLLISSIESITLDVLKKEDKLNFILKDFSSSANFESQSTYLTSAKLNSFELIAKSIDNDIVFSSSNLNMNISSNTQGNNAQFFSKSSLDNLSINSKELNLKAEDFNYDISVDGLDKDALEEFRILTSKTQNNSSQSLENELQKSVVNLFSHGLVINIADFSLKSILLNDKEDLEGFKVQAVIAFKEDQNLAKKIGNSPMQIAQNIDASIKIKLSKKMFVKLVGVNSMVSIAESYAKEEGSNFIYEITFKNGELKVNNKVIL